MVQCFLIGSADEVRFESFVDDGLFLEFVQFLPNWADEDLLPAMLMEHV